MSKIFITGGISSGKSSFAENTALSIYKSAYKDEFSTHSGLNLMHFVATGKELDEEMALKIKKHKEKRDSLFIVHENFDDLISELKNIYGYLCVKKADKEGIILIDSTTMWLSSIFNELSNYDAAFEHIKRFSNYISTLNCSVVTVSDSLAFNMVPADAYARKFIDLNGLMEQELSAVSDKAYCVIAGNPVILK